MIVNRSKKAQTDAPQIVDLVNTEGNTDYIKGGKVYKNAPTKVVLISAESDLAVIKNNYEPGTIAYTAGFKKMWQLDESGTWVEV